MAHQRSANHAGNTPAHSTHDGLALTKKGNHMTPQTSEIDILDRLEMASDLLIEAHEEIEYLRMQLRVATAYGSKQAAALTALTRETCHE
jgi:hypothetical protein